RLAADGPAAEGDVHVLADVAVAVGHRLERLHQYHPLRHAAHRRLLLDLPHGAGGRLLPRLRDAPDHGPRAGVGPAVQQHSVLVVEDEGGDPGEPQQLMTGGLAQRADEIRGSHAPDPNRPVGRPVPAAPAVPPGYAVLRRTAVLRQYAAPPAARLRVTGAPGA